MKKVLRFTASWCGPCKMLAKTLEEVDTKLPIDVIDIDEKSDLAVQFGIRSVPTLVLVDGEVEIKRSIGNKTKQELEVFING